MGDPTGVIGLQPQLSTAGEKVAQLPPGVISAPVLQAVWPPPPFDRTTDEWAARRNERLDQRPTGAEVQHLGVNGVITVAVLTHPDGMVVFLAGKFPI